MNHSCDDFSVNRSKYTRTVFVLIHICILRKYIRNTSATLTGFADRRSCSQSLLRTSIGTRVRVGKSSSFSERKAIGRKRLSNTRFSADVVRVNARRTDRLRFTNSLRTDGKCHTAPCSCCFCRSCTSCLDHAVFVFPPHTTVSPSVRAAVRVVRRIIWSACCTTSSGNNGTAITGYRVSYLPLGLRTRFATIRKRVRRWARARR